MPETPVPPADPSAEDPDSRPPLSDDQLRALGGDFLITSPLLEPDPIQPLSFGPTGQPSREEFFANLKPILPNPQRDYADAFAYDRLKNGGIDPSFPPLPAPPPPSRRKRGAQPGNLNALKHGLYIDGRRLKNTTPLERAELFDLNELIENIKSFMQFTYDYGIRCRNMAEINETMRSLSLAAMSLTRLIGVHDEFMSTPLPHDMKVTKRTDVANLIEHLRKKLAPVADLTGVDLSEMDEQ